MLRNAFFAAVLVLLVACSQTEGTGSRQLEGEQSSSSGSTSSATGTGGSGGSAGGTGGASAAVCDEKATCGDYVNGCTGCAVSTVCAEVYDGCFGDDACLDFNKCLANCKEDKGCQDECASANPVGADRFGALLTCIVCQVCPKSCLDFAGFCL